MGFWRRGYCLCAAISALHIGLNHAASHPVNATFTINSADSNLSVRASTALFSDTDTQSLNGTINTVFDFGQGGSFLVSVDVTVTDANIAPEGPFNLRLGFPQIGLGADIAAANLRATVTTPMPPAEMTRTGAVGTVYQFDASQFLLIVNQGTIVVTGSANETSDLSQDPVTGVSPEGTLGTVEFTVGTAGGYYTLVNAALAFPIQITDVVESETGALSVELQLHAQVYGTSSFYVALTGVPGDFDHDGAVDPNDLLVFEANFGRPTGAMAISGDADRDGDSDGNDFLAWQRDFGARPPSVSGAATVPEPGCKVLATTAIALGATLLRRWPSIMPS